VNGYKVGGHVFTTGKDDRVACESCGMAYRDFLRDGGGCVVVFPSALAVAVDGPAPDRYAGLEPLPIPFPPGGIAPGWYTPTPEAFGLPPGATGPEELAEILMGKTGGCPCAERHCLYSERNADGHHPDCPNHQKVRLP
jgi:hypothetical protein